MLVLVHLIAKTSNVLEKDGKTESVFKTSLKKNVLVRLISLKNRQRRIYVANLKAKLELFHNKGMSGPWLFVLLHDSREDYCL